VKWLSGDRITGILGARRQYIGKGRPTEADKSGIANLGRGFPYAPEATNKKLRARGLLRQESVSPGDLYTRTIPSAWSEDFDDLFAIKAFWEEAQGEPQTARRMRRPDEWEREQ